MKSFYSFIGIISAALLAGGCAVFRTTGPITDHFDGRRFTQPGPRVISLGNWIKRRFAGRKGAWHTFVTVPYGTPPSKRVGQGNLRVTFVNHATMLIQMDGVNILTDPIWANRSVPVVGPRRRKSAGIRFEDLPPIDVVLVSHDHQDHMDVPTLRKLARAHHPVIYCGLGNADAMKRKRISGGHDLDWWESVSIAPGFTVTAVPARHTSGRIPPLDRNRTLWCGFVLTGPSGSVYFAGDTGWGSHFEAIAERFPNVRLALIPIGGFKPVWYMRQQHTGPVDLVKIHRILRAGMTIPMHFGTFPNGQEAQDEPPSLLRSLLARNPDIAPEIIILDNGQSFDVPPVHRGGSKKEAGAWKSE